MPCAAEGWVPRRDGFLLIWESIRRPAEEQITPEFDDVQLGDLGFTEISYACERHILDDAENFRPNDPLLLSDALVWLYRTRNVDELDAMEEGDLPVLLARYPLVEPDADLSARLSRDMLFQMIRSLDAMLAEEIHEVSFYADDFHGNGTAFGETFDMNALTAAHRTFPPDTLVRVINQDNGLTVTVRVNDRGPYVEGRDMDLSLAAFEEVADRSNGVIRARFQRLGDQSLVDMCTQEAQRFQKRITRDVRFHRGIPHVWQVGKKLSLGANRFFVVRGVTYPDGTHMRTQDWVGTDERFHFTPAIAGTYIFLVGTADGRRREMRMIVQQCGGQQ